MTDPVQPRPQPVVDLASFGANIVVVVGGLAFIVDGVATYTHWTWAISAGTALTGAAAFLGKYVPKLAAVGAAAQVTPLSDPRDHQMQPLSTGRHAAPEDYSDGGYIPGGAVPYVNTSGQPEQVITAEQARQAGQGFLDRLNDHSPSMGPDLPDEPQTVETPAVTSPPEQHMAQWHGELEDWLDKLRHRDDTQEMPVVTTPAKTDEPQRHIPEHVIPGRRLGRHVNHDPRSLSYLVPETTTPTTAMWTRRVPVFDQGNLGSCTGNAAAGVLGTDPFYATLPSGLTDDENEAVKLYSSATSLDSYPGAYPPDDTGSDGLSVAKACQKAGLISGYQHITSVAAAQTAIKSGPFIVGVNWYSSMDNPDADGLVKVSGSIRGGHEFECHGYDAAADLWWFTNSWGTSWGKDGRFCMSSASFARLLSEQGDATVFLPVSQPAPQPTPTPQPPSPAPTGFPLAEWDAYNAHHYSRPKEEAMRSAVNAWLGKQ